MVATFAGVFIVHFFIVQVLYKPFGVAPMSAALWIKCVFVATLIVVVSELFKLFYRALSLKRTAEQSESLGGGKTFAYKVNKNQIKA